MSDTTTLYGAQGEKYEVPKGYSNPLVIGRDGKAISRSQMGNVNPALEVRASEWGHPLVKKVDLFSDAMISQVLGELGREFVETTHVGRDNVVLLGKGNIVLKVKGVEEFNFYYEGPSSKLQVPHPYLVQTL
jgi:hypothetical protein